MDLNELTIPKLKGILGLTRIPYRSRMRNTALIELIRSYGIVALPQRRPQAEKAPQKLSNISKLECHLKKHLEIGKLKLS